MSYRRLIYEASWEFLRSTSFVFTLQEKKLQEEIHQLKDEDRRLDMYIRERKTEYEKQELLIAKGQKDSDHLRRQRDELQDTRKYGSFYLL